MNNAQPSPRISGWRHLATGKVRELFVPDVSSTDGEADMPDALLLVATDRISAFDHLLEPAITGKGALLTKLSRWWFSRIDMPNHLVSDEHLAGLPPVPADVSEQSMLCERLDMLEIECVVRGAVTGSGFAEYESTGAICGISLPSGLRDGDLLEEPIFTPAWKAPQGAHDENITFDQVVNIVGSDTAEELRAASVRIFREARDRAASRGLLLADTKFEFGRHPVSGALTLADEVLTSDSSRYWDLAAYEDPTRSRREQLASFDKQIVRNWLLQHWNRTEAPPELPAEIVSQTRARYTELLDRLTAET